MTSIENPLPYRQRKCKKYFDRLINFYQGICWCFYENFLYMFLCSCVSVSFFSTNVIISLVFSELRRLNPLLILAEQARILHWQLVLNPLSFYSVLHFVISIIPSYFPWIRYYRFLGMGTNITYQPHQLSINGRLVARLRIIVFYLWTPNCTEYEIRLEINGQGNMTNVKTRKK